MLLQVGREMKKLNLLATAGLDAPSALHVDDVFAVNSYLGTGASLSVVNGIDCVTNNALVWIKCRNSTTTHYLFDTLRGATYELNSPATDASAALAQSLTSFDATGFTVGTSTAVNTSGGLNVAWTFRAAPNFFDVQTKAHTTGSASTVDLSSLGTVGTVMVKASSTTGEWYVWHRSLTAGNNLRLQTSAAQSNTGAFLSVSGTTLTLASGLATATYVVYAWAHNTAADGFIQCGTYTGNGSATGPTVTLGWEPQVVVIKRINSTGSWNMFDTQRGIVPDGNDAQILANTTAAEVTNTAYLATNPTGFNLTSTAAETNTSTGIYAYIAIRRSTKPPTSGSQVFHPTVYTGNNTAIRRLNTTITPDMVWLRRRAGADAGYEGFLVASRYRALGFVKTELNFGAEAIVASGLVQPASGYGHCLTVDKSIYIGNASGATTTSPNINANTTADGHVALAFKRATGVFDQLYYAGTGADRNLDHQLGVAPEMVIVRKLTTGSNWIVWHSAFTSYGYQANLDLAGGQSGPYNEFRALPTATQVFVNGGDLVNAAGAKYIALLFATRAGVSKVGSYVGNGAATQNIECGFSTGARFILIKSRSTGNWFVYDTARGIGSGNDPFLTTNTRTAENTATSGVAAYSGGFQVTNSNPPDLNVNGTTYIYLAIS